MTKASDNEFPSVLFDEQAGDPSTPASGFWRAYFKSDGMYVIDDAGTVTGPFGPAGGGGVTAVQASSATGDGSGSLTNSTTSSWTDVTGASITFTTQARRVKIGFVGSATNDNASAINSFTVDVDGSPAGGSLGLLRDQMDGTASRFRNVSFVYMTGALSAASHTFKIQWRVSAGTGTLLNLSASAVWHMWAEEVPS